jgi:hypothetical protein
MDNLPDQVDNKRRGPRGKKYRTRRNICLHEPHSGLPPHSQALISDLKTHDPARGAHGHK